MNVVHSNPAIFKSPKMKVGFFILMVLLHAVLAFCMRLSPTVATLHAYVTIAVALYWALRSDPLKVACMGAYITGAEVLWRMTDKVFYEIGKYGLCLTFGVFLFTKLSRGLKRPWLPLLYFALLLPAVFLTGIDFNNSQAFGTVRGNLSGPLALMISVLFFSRISLTQAQLSKILTFFLYPALTLGFIAALSIHTAQNLQFVKASNYITSGGFNPTEASAILGLGVFFIYFYLMTQKTEFFLKTALFLAGIFLAAQTVLTFSRGGVYGAVISIVTSLFFLIQNGKVRRNLMIIGILGALLGYFVIWPKLITFTNGVILERFKDTSLTHRDEIIRDDLKIWREHFWIGVGPGRVTEYRGFTVRGMHLAAHTEYSRLLAEHGVLGLLSILILILMTLMFLKRARTNIDRAFVISMTGWAFAYMFTTATRTATPSFVFGMAALVPLLDGKLPKLKPVE